ncbi:MAG: lipoyl domain-containing protein [Streptococcus salivarius]
MVNEGDILLEIMSDKTNMELEAEDSGVLLKITVKLVKQYQLLRLLVILEQKVKLWLIMLRAHRLQKLLRKLKKLLLWKHL